MNIESIQTRPEMFRLEAVEANWAKDCKWGARARGLVCVHVESK